MPERLIVLSGLPGTGKSLIADSLAAHLRAPAFAKDWLQASLLRNDVAEQTLSAATYDLMTTLARRQLMLGQSAILDSVVGRIPVRERWRALAREFDARWLVIECVCSDAAVHRERLVARKRDIPDWPELAWSDVERARSIFEPWREDRLVLDSMEAREDNLSRAIAYVDGAAIERPTVPETP